MSIQRLSCFPVSQTAADSFCTSSDGFENAGDYQVGGGSCCGAPIATRERVFDMSECVHERGRVRGKEKRERTCAKRARKEREWCLDVHVNGRTKRTSEKDVR